MDLAVPNTLALVRAGPAAAAPLAETLVPAGVGSPAPALQGMAPAAPDQIGEDRRHPCAGKQAEKPDPVAPLRPAAPVADGLGNRYRFTVAHKPDLDRPLLQIVDKNTDQILVSLPPEQLARMLEDTKAMVEDQLRQPHVRHLDTIA